MKKLYVGIKQQLELLILNIRVYCNLTPGLIFLYFEKSFIATHLTVKDFKTTTDALTKTLTHNNHRYYLNILRINIYALISLLMISEFNNWSDKQIIKCLFFLNIKLQLLTISKSYSQHSFLKLFEPIPS
jgi:hypothetical protein